MRTRRHAGTARELTACFDLVTTSLARLMNLDSYGIAIGHPADVVVLDCADPAAAVAELGAARARPQVGTPDLHAAASGVAPAIRMIPKRLLASCSTPVRPTMQPYPRRAWTQQRSRDGSPE